MGLNRNGRVAQYRDVHSAHRFVSVTVPGTGGFLLEQVGGVFWINMEACKVA